MKSDNSTSPLDQWLSRKKKTVTPAIVPLPEGADAVLSYGQERLWLLEQLYPQKGLYNYAHHYRISGSLNLDILTQSFELLADRHEILKTNYRSTSSGIIQEVNPNWKLPVEHIYLEEQTPPEQQATLSKGIVKAGRFPFDLATDPLFQLTIFHLGNEEVELVVAMHHIVGDGWSMGLINSEVSKLYQLLWKGVNPVLAPLPHQYKEFAHWQRSQQVKEADVAYWKERLSDDLPVLDLPMSKPSGNDSFAGQTYTVAIPTATAQAIKSLARESGTTLFVLLLTVYKVFLSRYSTQTDVVVATPFSNRDLPELEQLIGFFNETVVLRTDLSAAPSFKVVLEQVKKSILDALAHKNVPFDTLVKEINPDRQAGENPLFQTMFLHNASRVHLNLGAATQVQEKMLDLNVSKFDLSLFVNESGEQLELAFEYSSRMEEAQTKAMAGHFITLLQNIVAAPGNSISSFSLLSEAEQQTMLNDWNSHTLPLPSVGSVHELIHQQTKKNPDAIAVTFGKEQLTFLQLDLWSDSVAKQLRSSGIQGNQFVGLYTHRSLEMVVGILAILKVGAAYLPLDPDYPENRLDFMLADAKASFVLVHPDLEWQSNLTAVQPISIHKTPAQPAQDTEKNWGDQLADFAYAIYTSGSSGQPKGVAVTHKNLLHSTVARFDFYEDPMGSFLLLSSFSFDSSITGIFWSLCSGGTLVLPPDRIEQDIHQLGQIIQEKAVTHTLLLPSLYQALLHYATIENLSSLVAVMVAGEACSAPIINTHFDRLPKARLYNEYGPTEASVWCIAHEITRADATGTVPIGKPIVNASAYILDQYLQPVPTGVKGELYIGGAGITDGYLNRPELTEERFLSTPVAEGRLYKTGDLAKFRADGVIDFLGRADHQIKIRGYRVELEEIKARILEQDAVTDALVVVNETESGKRLVAYIQTTQTGIESNLRELLKAVLPAYMVPSAFVLLSAFPLLPNGKVNLHQLPEPGMEADRIEEFVAPATDTEKLLARIWQDTLKLAQIGIHDNFFDIGGDSILSIQIVAKARDQNIQLGPTDLLRHQTISKLALHLSGAGKTDDWLYIVPMKTTGNKHPLFCLHSGGAHVTFYQGLAKHMALDHPVYAIQPAGVDGQRTYHDSIDEMARHYIAEMKKVQPKGPYHLIGTCFSNAVVLEMAHHLHASNDAVGALYIIDSAPAYLVPPSPNGERKPISRMAAMVREGNWNGIRKKFRNRFIRANRKMTQHQRNSAEWELDAMIDSLNALYVTYTWKPLHEKMVLIRSDEFSQRKDKQFHLDSWNILSKGNLEVHTIPGHHLSMFDEPEVQEMAQLVGRLMSGNAN